jgi:hypothetical protein
VKAFLWNFRSLQSLKKIDHQFKGLKESMFGISMSMLEIYGIPTVVRAGSFAICR